MTSSFDATLPRSGGKPAAPDGVHYELTLFVGGASDISARAITNARQLCDAYLGDRYRLTVVDLHETPAAVLDGRVLIAPTLVKDLPLPVRKVIGDLSQTDRVLLALDLPFAKRTTRAELIPHAATSFPAAN
jgi:circadian clock protein KaiB